VFSGQAAKDMKRLQRAGLADKVIALLHQMQSDPFVTPPRYEKLVGNLKGFCSRRINIQHRLVYAVDTKSKVIHVLRCWTHYE